MISCDITPGKHQVVEPECQAINQDHASRRSLTANDVSNFKRLFKRQPFHLGAIGLMAGNAGRHFVVERRCGCEIKPFKAGLHGQPLGKSGFPRARAAEHES